MSSARMVDACGAEVTLESLQQVAPRLGVTTRVKLLAKLRQSQEKDFVDSRSFQRCTLRGTAPELRRQVLLTKHATGSQLLEVTYENVVRIPWQLLPDNAGVDLRGRHYHYYNTIAAEHIAEVAAAVKERADSIAHCEKLLRDLPVALANSLAALAAHVAAVDVELSELGAMLLEQARIELEVAAQTTKLAELEASAVPQLDKSQSTSHWVQTIIHLQFGLNRLGSQLILVTRSPDDTSQQRELVVQLATEAECGD